MDIRRLLVAGVVLATASMIVGTSSGVPRPCAEVEGYCTHRFATTLAVATNEFEKFKWDFMRRLDKLGTDASDEDIQDLVDIFSDKFVIRGRVYKRFMRQTSAVCRSELRNCRCPSAARGQSGSACRSGFKANVQRRGWSYKTLLERSVWECIAEIKDLAGLGED